MGNADEPSSRPQLRTQPRTAAKWKRIKTVSNSLEVWWSCMSAYVR